MAPARFYLVRHGEAEGGASGGDAARRLTPGGRARFAALARAVGPRLALSRILTSPLLRARETAELLAGATGAAVQEDDALGSARSTGGDLLQLGRRAGAGAALVGHNPELAEAVGLAGGDHRLPPGAIAAIDVDGETCTLAWLEAPPT